MATGHRHQKPADRRTSRQSRAQRRLSQAAVLVSAALAMTTVCLPAAAAEEGATPPGKRFAPGRILAQPRAGLSDVEFRKVLGKEKGRLSKRLNRLGVAVVEVPAGAEEAIAKRLARHEHMKFAEVDLAIAPDLLPNDQYYGNAWHLPKIQADLAWERSLGDGVTVAVLDTGVDANHLDLGANLLPGWNSVSGSSDASAVSDINNHGTWVSGVVAALSNNSLGVASVAWNAKVLPVRVTNTTDGVAYTSDIANGLTWAADHGAKVANISYGVSGSATVSSAAQYVRSKGGVVCVSAGNSGADPGYAKNETVISVSATNSSDTRTSWSSYGSYVDFAAPGEGIQTTARGGGYSSVSGTSFSSPMTAGLVALMMAANPKLTPTDIEAILQNTADDLGTPGWDAYYGFGRINAAEAVKLAANSTPSDTEAPKATVTSPGAGSTVSGLVAVDVSGSDNYGVIKVELYANGKLVGTEMTSSYKFSWDTTGTANGSATLSAKAYDTAGNVGTSPSVTVTVSNGSDDTVAPQVTITSPSDGATVGGTVSLAASATDNDKVSMVSLYVDGKLMCSGAPSVSCSWNTRKASSGGHTVSATAKDAAENSATTSVSVSVGSTTTKTVRRK